MQQPHKLSRSHYHFPSGKGRYRPGEDWWETPKAQYLKATEGDPMRYRARLWEVSEAAVARYATISWPFLKPGV